RTRQPGADDVVDVYVMPGSDRRGSPSDDLSVLHDAVAFADLCDRQLVTKWDVLRDQHLPAVQVDRVTNAQRADRHDDVVALVQEQHARMGSHHDPSLAQVVETTN